MRAARGAGKASTGEAPKLLVGDPQLTATPQEGVTAVCTDPPVWGSLPITKAYRWQLDGSDIAAAPGVDPTVSDFPVPTGGAYAGHLLRKAVVYTNSIGSITRYSNALSVQASAPAPTPPAPPPSGGTGTATFGWDTPALDGDGGTLSDLANYRVRAGYASGVYTIDSGLLPLSQASTVSTNDHSYTLTGLTNGQTIYVTVVAVDSGGNESHFSTEMTKAIP